MSLLFITSFLIGIAHADQSNQNLADTSTKLIPLPIYATEPNEGSTYGFMPVFLIVETKDQYTKAIIAPSISWNATIKYTGTFRWYYYPTADKTFTLIPSFSTHVNRGIFTEYLDLPKDSGTWTTETLFRMRQNLFFRFFGIGPDTPAGSESSNTRVGGIISLRRGYNITKQFNIGVKAELKHEVVQAQGVSGLPLTLNAFPGTPGLGGATVAFQGLNIRYDTRQDHQFSKNGWASELTAGFNEGLAESNNFSKLEWESRLLFQETAFLQGAARSYWSYVGGGSNIPFYYQNSLGGSHRLRGFIEDRFIDKGAWEVELEQRIGIFQTHIYGVTTDWRIDPFIAAGQVYNDFDHIASHVRYSGGLGFRAWVHPNVLGRVDTAVGGEGILVYVELGYPF